MKPVLSGFIVGAAVALLVVIAGATLTIANKLREAAKGWDLRPVVVVSEDIPANTVLTLDMISQRSIPSQFVTPAMVLAKDASSVLGRAVTSAHQVGDPLEWQSFATLGGQPEIAECVKAIAPETVARADAARDEAIDAYLAAAGAPTDGPAPAAAGLPAADADGNVAIVIAKQNIPEATVLTAEMLEVKRWPVAYLTHSKVPANELAALVGSATVVPLEKGDPLHWQFLDDAKTPRSRRGCFEQADRAASAVVGPTAANEAQRFFAKEQR